MVIPDNIKYPIDAKLGDLAKEECAYRDKKEHEVEFLGVCLRCQRCS